MPKYLLHATYTPEGIRGLIKDGGTKRQAAAKALVESLGGKLESFHFAFGENDAVVIVELPDASSAAAASLAIGATGAVSGKVTVLLTPEELDRAAKKAPTYTPPGR